MLAVITKTPEFQISEVESQGLSNAIGRVGRHYNIGATEKATDWINLFIVVAMMYGTRFVAINQRRKDERRTEAKPANVYPFGAQGT